MWSGIGWDHKVELYFLTNLISCMVNFELVPCLKFWGGTFQKETSLAVHTFLIFKKNYNKRFGNVIEVWLWTFGDERI